MVAREGGSYAPAESGLAKYFTAMLDDADRNVQYSTAIKAAIDEFVAVEGRAPRVLDIGVGTGMLSNLCLLHGAAHVTGVDVNSTMVDLAKVALREHDPSGRRFTVRLVKPGKSQLGDARFDMLVSEILGTLTTSESMFKYLAIYKDHLNTFGEDGTRVYAVPRTTHQYFAIRAFSRSDLGPSLAAALDVAVTCADASRRLVPTNEGGLGLHLPLYSSTQVGERLTIHTERYDALLPNAKGERAFAYEGMGKGALIETAPLRDDDALPLGVFEWEVELWRDVWLRNTLDAYNAMPLRNAIARGSAWGFFVTALSHVDPEATSSLAVRGLALTPASKATPELVIGGERIGGNVCDEPMPFVTMAADGNLVQSFVRALQSGIGSSAARAPGRMLVVNDLTCGALPSAAAAMGFRVDVVNEHGTVSDASKEAAPVHAAHALAGMAAGKRDAPPCRARKPNGRRPLASNTASNIVPVAPLSEVPDDAARGCCHWATGRVDVGGPGSRKTRAVFEPDGLPNCYDAIVLPSLMLDVFTSASDEAAMRRAQQAEAITARWLAPGGMQLPARATVEEVVVQLDAHDLYHASLPHPALHLSGVEGALRALGAPCTAEEGGVLVPTIDGPGGIAFHGLHFVRAAGGEAAGTSRRQKARAGEPTPPVETVGAGVLGARAEMGVKGAADLEWSHSGFQSMLCAGDVRSAVARAMYQGVQVRLQRAEGKRKAKKAKLE